MATKSTCNLVLITGVPGIGKTTLVSELSQALVKQGVTCSGFITEEVRSSGKRVGFDVVTLAGQRGQLAKVSDDSQRMPGTRQQREYRVGQYSVNLLTFEQTALPSIHIQKQALSVSTSEASSNNHVYVVDEIGKMELFSDRFIKAVQLLMNQSNITMVATIPVPKGRPLAFVEQVRSTPGADIFEVTRANRDSLLPEILSAVLKSTKS